MLEQMGKEKQILIILSAKCVLGICFYLHETIQNFSRWVEKALTYFLLACSLLLFEQRPFSSANIILLLL